MATHTRAQDDRLQKGIALLDDIAKLHLLIAILEFLGIPVARVVAVVGGRRGSVAVSLRCGGTTAASRDGGHGSSERSATSSGQRRKWPLSKSWSVRSGADDGLSERLV